MTGRHNGFIANCKADPDFSWFFLTIMHHPPTVHLCQRFDHVMTPVIKIISKFLVIFGRTVIRNMVIYCCIQTPDGLAEEVLHCFLAPLTEIKAFMEARNEDTTLLSDTEWLLDLAFLADVREKLNNLSCELQGKGKTISDMISAVKAFKAKLGLFLQ